MQTKTEKRIRLKAKIRAKIRGTKERPRLSVFRSNKFIYAQVIDDISGVTLVSASTIDKELRSPLTDQNKTEQAKSVGKAIAERARAQGVEQVVFDRGGFPYHGRIKALADGSREAGLVF